MGEIVLVVIGILIALSISNWNEIRKQRNTTYSIYSIVKEDLIKDISVIDSFLKEYDEVRKPSFEAVLNRKLTKEDWLNHPEYISVISGFKDFSINQRGANLLKSQSNLTVNIEQNLASKINSFYHQHMIEIDVAVTEVGNSFEDNVKNYQKYDWFASFFLHNEMEDVIDDASNNLNVKNRITFYYIVFEVYTDEL